MKFNLDGWYKIATIINTPILIIIKIATAQRFKYFWTKYWKKLFIISITIGVIGFLWIIGWLSLLNEEVKAPGA